MEKPFVHLHNHSDYSLLDGACKVQDMVMRAGEFGMPAVALTDHGNMFGAIDLYSKASAQGIKPIIGMEAYVAVGDRKDRTAGTGGAYHHLTLLSETGEGYHNLIRLSSIGFLEGFYYKPRIDRQALDQHHRGLIALSGCARGPVADLIYRNKPDQARAMAAEYRDLFGPDNFFIEIMDHGLEIERQVTPGLLEVAGELKIPLVVTNDIHYLLREHSQAQDVLVCIQTGKELEDTERMKFETPELYFKSPEEMYALFPDHPEALRRTVEIAERCNVELEFDNSYLPAFPLPEGYTEGKYLEKLSWDGARGRYGKIDEKVEKRLRLELDIIEQTGFPGYFLIVSDFVGEARRLGIPVGPGRGSAAGSLVSYCLRITNIDPLRYNLLFERFLNPERVTMPDIDIDFSDRDRDRIIQYVKNKYGQENVAQIITFGTMGAHAVVRDVGRVMGMPYGEVDQFAKLIPRDLGMTLEKALHLRPEMAERAEKDPKIDKLLRISRMLEGVSRHASTHAGGVVIAPGNLLNYVPLYKSTRNDEILTQYDKDCVEKIGLMKMDLLGLRTLTVIQDTLEMIERRTGKKIDLDKLSLDDKATFELLKSGETTGVFQFESSGMQEYLRKLRPETVEDMIAMNALYRPGPLGSGGMIDDFINRKHGRIQVRYLHATLEHILKETYGVIVYQEQVMQIASEMAGFSLGEADHLRRAMGKKKKDVMEQQKEKFLDGARQRGVEERVAGEVFELMAHFAGYGFNKSHSAGYAIVAYQTAFLKAHYPAEFMAAGLTSEMNRSDRLAVLLEECRRMKIKVLPPDINESGPAFTVVEEGIRFGLAAIKNVGRGAVEMIQKTREEGGRFVSLGDFLDRVDPRVSNRRLVESLIFSGAINSLPGTQEQLLTVLDETINVCASRAAERSSGQISLFGGGDPSSAEVKPVYPALPENYDKWDSQQPLNFEKEYLGFYISGHPLDKYSEELDSFCNSNTVSYEDQAASGNALRLGGMINSLRTFFDRKNREWCIITLEDRYGMVDVFAFSEVFERHREVIYQGSFVLVSGRLNRRQADERSRLVADWLMGLDKLRADEGVGAEIRLDIEKTGKARLQRLQKIMLRHKGNNPVYLKIVEPNGEHLLRSRGVFAFPSDELLAELRAELGDKQVYLGYHPHQIPGARPSNGALNGLNSTA